MARAGGVLSMTFKGGTRAAKKMARGADQIRKRSQSRALRAAAKPIRDDAKAFVDTETGTLEESIKVRAGKRKKNYVVVTVQTGKGFFQGEAFYGAFVEFGHRLGKRPGKGQADNRAVVMPDPYLQPAFDRNKRTSVEIYNRVIRQELRKAFLG